MITFLPFADFNESAKVLDYKRLGKQRIETRQLLATLIVQEGIWLNHPAARMWEGFERALVEYGFAICNEWTARGYRDSQYIALQILESKIEHNPIVMPPWLGDERLHSNHRARLLSKNPDYYQQFGWKENPIQEYWWPTNEKTI